MPAGRPSVYEEGFCDIAIELGKEGKSMVQIASHLGVSKQTLFNWSDSHPEFLAAITQAKTHSQAWWESLGQDNILSSPGTVLNGSVWSRSMAARFPDDWRENKALELTGANGGPVESVTRVELVAPPANGNGKD